MSISVVLIVQNEEGHIDECLRTASWADEIIVVDGGSEDDTLARARIYTDKIFEIPFTDFATQKNEAISRATGDWVFVLDADERISAELRGELIAIRDDGRPDACYAVGRRTFFFGKELRFSGSQTDYPIRFFPRSAARFFQPVHEVIETRLPVKKLESKLLHFSTRDKAHYREKLDRYLPYEIDGLAKRTPPVQRIDGLIRPVGKFIHLYFIQRGFLDGWAGFQFATLSTLYSFLKYREHFKRQANRQRGKAS